MKPTTLATTALLALISSGCLTTLTLHPLHTDDTRIFDPALGGLWQDKKDKDYLIVEPQSDKSYRVVWVTEDSNLRFQAWLVQLGPHKIADFQPVESPGAIPGHSFARIALDGDVLRIAFVDSDALARSAAAAQIPRMQAGKTTVLTPPTRDLQALLLKFLNESWPMDLDEEEFRRVRSAATQTQGI